MYGKGTSTAFTDAVAFPDLPKAKIAQQEDGSVQVHYGKQATLKIACSATNVHYTDLQAPEAGLYEHLVGVLPQLFKDRGVATFTATPAGSGPEKALKARAPWKKRKGRLVWEL